MHGLYLLWWVGERGLSPAIVAAVLAVGDSALFVLEVPTGWVADRFGHRTSMVAGSIVQVLGMLACWFGAGVPELIVASVLIALGDALRSGADQALLFRTCAALDREVDFLRITATARSAGLLALVLLTVAGGVIVERWGFAMGWLVETVLCAIGALLAMAMVEPPAAAPPSLPDDVTGRDACARERPLRRWGRSAALIAPAALIGGLASAAGFLAQVSVSLAPSAATVVVAGITLAEAAGVGLSPRSPFGGLRGQWMLLAVATLVMLGASVLPLTLATMAVALSFTAGLSEPRRAELLQRTAADHRRARTASCASACDMACSAAMLWLAGIWRTYRQ